MCFFLVLQICVDGVTNDCLFPKQIRKKSKTSKLLNCDITEVMFWFNAQRMMQQSNEGGSTFLFFSFWMHRKSSWNCSSLSYRNMGLVHKTLEPLQSCDKKKIVYTIAFLPFVSLNICP